MSQELKLSLIISAHNEEGYIGDTLAHIIEATVGLAHEIIVVDNASTDDTARIASTFDGVRVIYEGEKGLTKSRERGFRESSGDLLAFLDADGHMSPEWPKKVIAAFSRDPELACFSGPALYYDMNGFMSVIVRIYWLFGYAMYLVIGYMAQGGNFVLRRSALEEMGGFDTNIAFYGEDTDIARRASKVGRVRFSLLLPMYTSARRFKGQGIANTAVHYVKNFFSVAFFGRPATEEYVDFR